MGKSDPQFLRRLEEQSRKKQETFMANISERLGRKRPEQAPEHSFRGAPDFWKRHSLGVEERIALFMENWTKAGGHARRSTMRPPFARLLPKRERN